MNKSSSMPMLEQHLSMVDSIFNLQPRSMERRVGSEVNIPKFKSHQKDQNQSSLPSINNTLSRKGISRSVKTKKIDHFRHDSDYDASKMSNEYIQKIFCLNPVAEMNRIFKNSSRHQIEYMSKANNTKMLAKGDWEESRFIVGRYAKVPRIPKKTNVDKLLSQQKLSYAQEQVINKIKEFNENKLPKIDKMSENRKAWIQERLYPKNSEDDENGDSPLGAGGLALRLQRMRTQREKKPTAEAIVLQRLRDTIEIRDKPIKIKPSVITKFLMRQEDDPDKSVFELAQEMKKNNFSDVDPLIQDIVYKGTYLDPKQKALRQRMIQYSRTIKQ